LRKISALLLCCSTLLLISCAAKTTEVHSTWKDDTHTERFSSIFVFALIVKPGNRRLVEENLVAVLREAGVDAYITYDLFPTPESIDEISAAAAVIKEKGDGLMEIRLLAAENVLYQRRPRRYGTDSTRAIDYSMFMVESSLYTVNTNELVWSAQTTTSETSVAEAIDSYISAMGTALKASGLYKKQDK
jgi:hypothetical protein